MIYLGNYILYKNGTVFSLLSNKYLKPQIIRGYYMIRIGKKRQYLHRLLAINFIENVDPDKSQVDHIDGNKLNNNLDNLEWVTPSENVLRYTKLNKTGYPKLSTTKAKEIRELYNKGISQKSLANKYEVSCKLISDVINFKRWK